MPDGIKQTIFCSFVLYFRVGSYNKQFMTGSVGNSEFCFPWSSMRFSGNHNALSLLGPVIKCLIVFFFCLYLSIKFHVFFIAINCLRGLCMVTSFFFHLGFVCFVSMHHVVSWPTKEQCTSNMGPWIQPACSFR